MQMLASDAANPQFVGAYNPDAALVVKFYSKAVHQPFKSNNEGRPIYSDVDYVTIFTPGSQLNIIDTPVRDEHRFRFAQQWAQYKAGQGTGMEAGTPVTAWPFLSGAQAEEFRALKFFTVEQLANASDFQLQSLGMVGGMNPHVIRDRAKAYLQAAAGTAPTEKLAQDNAELRQQLADMQRQIAAIASDKGVPVPAQQPGKPRGPRRTKKKRVKREPTPAQAAARAASGDRLRKMQADKLAARANEMQQP